MKPITDYLDYRCYMQDFYDERKRISAFTWREFARLAGFVSPTYLKLVCEGKTRLKNDGVERTALAMGPLTSSTMATSVGTRSLISSTAVSAIWWSLWSSLSSGIW